MRHRFIGKCRPVNLCCDGFDLAMEHLYLRKRTIKFLYTKLFGGIIPGNQKAGYLKHTTLGSTAYLPSELGGHPSGVSEKRQAT
jgi:hypothetical protein